MGKIDNTLYTQVEKLVNEAACRRLLEAYTYAIDWQNWAGLKELFWANAEFDFGLWQGDREGFLPWVQALEEGYDRRLHHFASPRLSIGDDEGQGEVGALLFMRVQDDGAAFDEIMAGRYQLGFTRRGDEWRMSRLVFLMHGVQRLPATDNGGADFFADGLAPSHPRFSQPTL